MLFTDLQKELDAIPSDKFWEPEMPVRPGYIIAGPMSEETKRLFTLYRQTRETLDTYEEKMGRAASEEERVAIVPEARETLAKADLLWEALWFAVKRDHNLWDKPSIGVSLGFQVVWGESLPEPKSSLRPFGANGGIIAIEVVEMRRSVPNDHKGRGGILSRFKGK